MDNNIVIREYSTKDKEAVLRLFDLNTPSYFSADEREELIRYLEEEIEYYFVVAYDGVIVGCGGINFSGDKTTAKISWDIFHPDYQGKSLGTRLLRYRLDFLKNFGSVGTIIVRTSQLVYRFYEKAGFRTIEIVEDYWAPGFHLYKMEYS